MAKMLNKFLCLALLTCASIVQANTIIIPRSQSVNAARELVGWQRFINLADMDGTYGAFSLTAEYQQSFRGARLMKCLFDGDIFLNNSYTTTTAAVSTTTSGCCNTSNNCNSNCNTASLLIQGSRVANRNCSAWLADYFGLPTDFSSVVTFKPKIQNAIFDFNLYLGFDECVQGLFFRIHAPIVWTRWNLCASEAVTTTGANGFDPGYMNSYTGVPRSSLASSFLSAINGTYTWGDMQTPLAHGVFCGNNSGNNGNCCGSFGSTTSTGFNGSCNNGLVRLSDIEAAFGYNFLSCEDYHFGLEIRGSAPTGNKPCNICLFEPIVGNGKFWTLGGGLTAHAVLWRDCECPDRTFSFYIDANVETLFKNCQSRSFDLAGLPNSRYMLVEKLGGVNATTPLFAGTAGAGTAVANQYIPGSLMPLINVSTFNANVSYAAQGDVALKFSYMTPNWDLDLGYEFWGRTREKVCVNSALFASNTYALKGDAFIYGFGASNSTTPSVAVPLSATESAATIHSGTNTPCASTWAIAQNRNPNVDSSSLALSSATGAANILELAVGSVAGTNDQRTSNPPVFLSASSFANNCCGNNGNTFTHKIFANISYSWECDCVSPFFGIGGEAEFAQCGGGSGNCGTGSCSTSTTSTSYCGGDSCAISQWGVWLKGGVGF